jgi:hypothetical protein
MVKTMTTKLRHRVLMMIALLAMPSAAFAHRLDEYLQATLAVIEPGEIRLQMNLTPGVAVADQVLTRIHPDDRGAILPREVAAYAESLRHDLIVRLDQRVVALQLTASQSSPPDELRNGSGIIQMEFIAKTGAFKPGAHTLSIQNRHLPAISVYLLNAGQPSFFEPTPSKMGSIEITAQKRNKSQSDGEIDFTFHPPPPSFHHTILFTSLAALFVGVTALGRAGKYLPRRAGALLGHLRPVQRNV